MKKFKIVALILVACLTFMLAGCDLFPQNTAAYLNQVVITATYKDGTKIEINRREYLTAYNNYGASLIQSNGYTEEQADEATVNALVNRKILLNEAKKDANVQAEVEKQKNELLYQTYEALISNANDYEEQIRKDWDMKEPDTMAEETASGTVYNPYKKQAEVVFVSNPNYTEQNGEAKGEYKIKEIKDDATPVRDKVFNSLDEVKTEFYAQTRDNNVDTFAKEEYRRYLASLKATQETLKTNKTNDELVKDEAKRIFDNLLENEYISEYQKQKQLNNGFSAITVNQVLNKYESMMSQSKFIYDNNEETYKKDMLENFKNVNYFANDEYFKVAHILIKFSDEQQEEYDNLKTLSNSGLGGVISPDYAKAKEQELYNSIKGSIRNSETGEITNEDTIAVNDILAEIETALSNASTNQQKDEAFRELMYKYNEDDGIMNADYAYVIGINDTKMVENFTNSSRELNENGVYGAVSGLVQTEYGIHIIYYMGQCKNLFEFSPSGKIDLQEYMVIEENDSIAVTSDVLKLTETKLNNLNNKTIFDLVYESLVTDNYSQYENINLETVKRDRGIQIKTLEKLR